MNDLDIGNYANDDIAIAEITDKDFEIIESADWNSIYNSLEQEEQRLLDELETIDQKNKNIDTNEQVYNLANECKDIVIDSILGPFGLSRAMFNDKDGGAVTTQHNAEKDIFAKDSEKFNREDYDFSARQREEIKGERKVNGQDKDQLTGRETTNPHVDHFTSAKKYHKKGGWMQNKERRNKFGTDERNLNVVDGSLNESLGEKDKYDYETQKSSRNPELTNKEDRGMDNRRVNAAQRRSDEAVKEHEPTTKERIIYHGTELGKEGAKAGLKLALRQALGCALKIMVEESFLIIKDAIKKYKEGTLEGFRSFILYIIEGLKNIRCKIQSHIKEIGDSALEGGISGIISTIVTFIINSFITTVKRVVTIIREATLSLGRAVKVLCDNSMPMEERMQAAGKIVFAGISTCIGIFLTEAISKFLSTNLPMLGSLSDDVANVFVSIVVGLAGILITYLFIQYKNNQIRANSLAEYNTNTDRIKELSDNYMQVSSAKVDVALLGTYQYMYSYINIFIDVQRERQEIEKIETEYNQEINSTVKEIDRIQSENEKKLSNLRKRIKK